MKVRADALVEGVEAGVDPADEHLGRQGRDHHRAVEVRGVRSARGTRSRRRARAATARRAPRRPCPERAVEVDGGDALGGLPRRDAGVRATARAGEVVDEVVDGRADRLAVASGVGRVEEVLPGCGHGGTSLRVGMSKVSLTLLILPEGAT